MLIWKSIVLVLSVLRHDAIGLIPHQCAYNLTKSGFCCPSDVYGDVCGGFNRGYCAFQHVYKQKYHSQFFQDDRIHWPIKFFTHLCKCHGNHFGVACDECWFGWEGSHCQTRSALRVRYNWVDMSTVQKKRFLDVMRLSYERPANMLALVESGTKNSDPIKNPQFIQTNIHHLMVFIHRFASRATLFDNKYMCETYGILDFNHDGPIFLPWHRYFMMIWERELQKLAFSEFGDSKFALPFWNWVDSKRCEVCTDSMAGGVGHIDKEGQRISSRSIFHDWIEYCSEPTDGARCYGCHYNLPFGKLTRRWNENKMPTTKDLDLTMSRQKFFIESEKDGVPCKSFHMAVEGFCGFPGVNDTRLYMHNYVHNALDGSMCCSAPATNDPLFIVHHVEIDRMNEAWSRDNSPTLADYPEDENLRPGHCLECYMVGFLPVVKTREIFAKDSRDFGYTYSNFIFGKQGRIFGQGYAANERYAGTEFEDQYHDYTAAGIRTQYSHVDNDKTQEQGEDQELNELHNFEYTDK